MFGLILTAQTAFAGQTGCQAGSPARPVCGDCDNRVCDPQGRDLPTCASGRAANAENKKLRDLAAAQMRYEQNPPTSGGLTSGDATAGSRLSFWLSILVILGGVWALFALLRNRFDTPQRRARRARLPKILRPVFAPSFALSAFAFLFVSAIVGSQMIAPPATTAQKREKPVKRLMTGFQNPSNKPVFKSARQFGGDGVTQIGAPVFDAAGNMYVRGGFTNNLVIGATTLTAANDIDAFVAKFDAGGNLLWVRQASGASGIPNRLAIEGATALAVDGSGSVYVGGSFVKSVTLAGGANPSVTLTDGAAAGINYESFVAKYDASGNLLWARGGNTNSPKSPDNLETGQNAVNSIVFDASGNPYVAGFVAGNNIFGSPLTNNGQTDILLARLDPATGAPVWKQIIGGTDDDNALDLQTDAAGNLYVIGNFGSPTVSFPTAPQPTTLTNPDGDYENETDTFIAKFDASGSNLWVEQIGNDTVVGGSQIAVTNAGEILLTGYFYEEATFGDTTLIETEGGDEGEAGLGGYVAKMNQQGEFVWARQFGGVGDALALDGTGRIYVAGTFWDGGTFGAGTPNEEILASFEGEDLFVARYDADGNFDFAKPLTAPGKAGLPVVGNPSDPQGKSENQYNPLGLAYNPARGTVFVSGDFIEAVALDCTTLVAPGFSRHSYVAELSADGETTACRIWNGLDDDDNNWDSPDNWNGGVLPSPGDSVFVPYTGNDFDPPTFNPTTDIPLTNLVIADDRILTLAKPLTVNGRLDLLGGFVDAENFPLRLGAAAQTFSVADGIVLGKIEKQFGAGGANSFTFPVGTAAADLSPEYSPVTLSNIAGAGTFSVTAHKGAYPNAAANLPPNRAARWWNLTNGGLTRADITFEYLPGDITTGTESEYRAYRIPTGGGTAMQVNSTIDTNANTVFAPNVSQFSDWTLAQIAPTAATVTIGGRVVSSLGRGIARARITITDATGNATSAYSNNFGYYRFTGVAAGQTVVLSVIHKRHNFEPRILTVTGDADNLNFAAK